MRVHKIAITIVLFVIGPFSASAQETPTAAKQPTSSVDAVKSAAAQAELEKKFAETMSNAVLVGQFTTRGAAAGPQTERYTLGKVAKQKDDYWLIETRIQYGTFNAVVPLSLRVVWSGDTPVITMDKVAVPGFGTFTCRVMIFNDQYAGMWDGGDHGGHLFGKIERGEKKAEEKK